MSPSGLRTDDTGRESAIPSGDLSAWARMNSGKVDDRCANHDDERDVAPFSRRAGNMSRRTRLKRADCGSGNNRHLVALMVQRLLLPGGAEGHAPT